MMPLYIDYIHYSNKYGKDSQSKQKKQWVFPLSTSPWDDAIWLTLNPEIACYVTTLFLLNISNIWHNDVHIGTDLL